MAETLRNKFRTPILALGALAIAASQIAIKVPPEMG